jgi:hypothetical protein
VADSFAWHWEASGAYSCRFSYLALCNGQTSILDAKELWRTRALRKCIFFMWTPFTYGAKVGRWAGRCC